ncbi:hypothetical protein [Agromyces badenianii]|uniref:hypothetical protein n=1 Tax=Agromyces badenianii TaxID=2080742 RepID=UPI000D592B49|nr:hypothetical protein [Agromyces badenianii]PWC05413.1 hypothetical protein DCE94_03835 [Agromyces badenianii]
MSAVEFSIVTADDTIPLVTDTNAEGTYLLLSGSGGLGIAPRQARFGVGAGEGGSYRGSRVLMRDPELVIRVYGLNRADTEANINRLVRAVVGRPGARSPRLVAQYATGEVYELPFVYVSGGEDSYLPDSSDLHTTIEFVTRTPKPFWTARDALSFTVRNVPTTAELLDDLAALTLSSATAFGVRVVDNPGDVDSYLDWEIEGPGGPATVTIDGIGFVVDAELIAGETRFVNGRLGEILDADGDSRYAELGPVPRFPVLPPGQSIVIVDLEAASPGAWVTSDEVAYTNAVSEPTLTETAATWSTWSDGNGTESHATSGFDTAGITGVAEAGYMQIEWAAGADPEAAIIVDVPVSAGHTITPSMCVWATRAQKVQAGLWLLNAGGDVVAAAFGPSTELPASTAVRMAIPGSVLGAIPDGVVSARFAVSTFVSECVSWESGDRFRGSVANATNSESVLTPFTGDTEHCDWTGDADESSSVQYALERVGESKIIGKWKPRKELVY